MTSEILATIIRANLVGGLAILTVLALRIPMRRAFGPELAYGLWAIPPIAFVATLMPPPVTLDDPVADHLPAWVDLDTNEASIRHLLSMRSGIQRP